MPLFDDDPDGFWAARFGMTPDDWQAAKTQAADAAGQAYDADTRAMATDDAQPTDGAGADKFQTAYQAGLNQQIVQRAAAQPPAPHMSISDNGLGFIQNREAYSPKGYVGQDSGNHTIGWGHKVLPGEDFSHGIDIESAQKLFRRDVGNAENTVRRHVTVPLNQNQYDALVSFAYNAGSAPFVRGQKFGDALNRGDFAGAVQEAGTWIHTHTKDGRVIVSDGLKRRRNDEVELFNRPTSP